MNRKYKLGMVVGRFQPFHHGHYSIISEALCQCDRVIVLIGSCGHEGTLENPFRYDFRKDLISATFNNERLSFAPLVHIGVGDSPYWGNYLMETAFFMMGRYPEAYFTGNEPDRSHWFENYNIEQIVVNRQDKPISATQIRKKMMEKDNSWYKDVPYGLNNIEKVERLFNRILDKQ